MARIAEGCRFGRTSVRWVGDDNLAKAALKSAAERLRRGCCTQRPLSIDGRRQPPCSGTASASPSAFSATHPGAWQYVGSAGSDKTFTDNTFTPGPDSVQYSIQAQRGNKFSPATAVVVNFGTGGGGEFNVSGVKLAA